MPVVLQGDEQVPAKIVATQRHGLVVDDMLLVRVGDTGVGMPRRSCLTMNVRHWKRRVNVFAWACG